jgi:hypothetical protein
MTTYIVDWEDWDGITGLYPFAIQTGTTAHWIPCWKTTGNGGKNWTWMLPIELQAGSATLSVPPYRIAYTEALEWRIRHSGRRLYPRSRFRRRQTETMELTGKMDVHTLQQLREELYSAGPDPNGTDRGQYEIRWRFKSMLSPNAEDICAVTDFTFNHEGYMIIKDPNQPGKQGLGLDYTIKMERIDKSRVDVSKPYEEPWDTSNI